MAKKNQIEASEFIQLLKEKPEIKKSIIDLRTEKDIKIYGKVMGSIVINQKDLQRQHKKLLTKKSAYYIISQDGEEAKIMTSALRMFRKYDAKFIVGGYKAIVDAKIRKE